MRILNYIRFGHSPSPLGTPRLTPSNSVLSPSPSPSPFLRENQQRPTFYTKHSLPAPAPALSPSISRAANPSSSSVLLLDDTKDPTNSTWESYTYSSIVSDPISLPPTPFPSPSPSHFTRAISPRKCQPNNGTAFIGRKPNQTFSHANNPSSLSSLPSFSRSASLSSSSSSLPSSSSQTSSSHSSSSMASTANNSFQGDTATLSLEEDQESDAFLSLYTANTSREVYGLLFEESENFSESYEENLEGIERGMEGGKEAEDVKEKMKEKGKDTEVKVEKSEERFGMEEKEGEGEGRKILEEKKKSMNEEEGRREKERKKKKRRTREKAREKAKRERELLSKGYSYSSPLDDSASSTPSLSRFSTRSTSPSPSPSPSPSTSFNTDLSSPYMATSVSGSAYANTSYSQTSPPSLPRQHSPHSSPFSSPPSSPSSSPLSSSSTLSPSLSQKEDDRMDKMRWNRKYQEIMDVYESHSSTTSLSDRIGVTVDLIHLSQDFVYTSQVYGKIIISEVYLPREKKTIQPISIGGVVS